jgi:hypothetical protein
LELLQPLLEQEAIDRKQSRTIAGGAGGIGKTFELPPCWRLICNAPNPDSQGKPLQLSYLRYFIYCVELCICGDELEIFGRFAAGLSSHSQNCAKSAIGLIVSLLSDELLTHPLSYKELSSRQNRRLLFP